MTLKDFLEQIQAAINDYGDDAKVVFVDITGATDAYYQPDFDHVDDSQAGYLLVDVNKIDVEF